MSNSMNNNAQLDSNEIDLVEIFHFLWDKKWWILLTTFITTLLSAVYAFTAKEQWTSKATVIAPKIADVGSYLALRSEYANILDIQDFTSNKIVDELFINFKTTLFSNKIKQEFLSQSKWFEDYLSEYGNDEDRKQNLISEILEKRLVATIPDLKKNPNALGIGISFSSETPKDAQSVLEEYIGFVNKSVLIEDKVDFLSDIRISIENLELKQARIQRDTENTRKVQLDNLKNALDIARSAEIKEYAKMAGNISIHHVNLGDAQIPFTDSKLSDGTYLFMLGEKYLQAQVDILTKNKIVYPVSFYTIDKQITLLKELYQKVDKNSLVSSYYYLSSPDYPVSRDKPKRLLILLIGFILGLVISAFSLVIKFLIKKS